MNAVAIFLREFFSRWFTIVFFMSVAGIIVMNRNDVITWTKDLSTLAGAIAAIVGLVILGTKRRTRDELFFFYIAIVGSFFIDIRHGYPVAIGCIVAGMLGYTSVLCLNGLIDAIETTMNTLHP